MTQKTFASDNYAGVHPKIMEALMRANTGHAPSYGGDAYTASAIRQFRMHFGEETEVYFAYNGTGANVLGLQALTRPYHAILCAEQAHIQVDESTAPEHFLGCKLITVRAPDGKMTAETIEERIQRIGDPHHPQIKAISLSQSTEYGTVYRPEELHAIAAVAKKYGLYLHMDGARIANAAVSLQAPFRAFTRDAGIDVLSFGGTKNGMMFGEAILIFRPELAVDFPYIRKQGMQLHSKMRFIGAQFDALLTDDLWKGNAAHANRMARLLAEELATIPHVTITRPVDANAVFAVFPPSVIPSLQQTAFFYVWNERTHEVRLMCAFDTAEASVRQLTGRLRELITSA